MTTHVSNPLIPRITSLMRILHIYSAMPVLLLMLFFAITGVFLNHPDWDKTQSKKQKTTVTAPTWLNNAESWDDNFQQQGLRLLQWLDANHDIRATKFSIEWDDYDRLLIIALDSPAGNTVIEVVVDDQAIIIDQRQLSLLAMLNNVHRAKHTNGLWLYLSDLSAVAMVLFCLSGFWLVAINRLQRQPAIAWFSGGSVFFIFVIYLMH
ncbi:PepSY-associated TM helix domain-containing protein [Colwellia sp. D2M02]|uniref:PepSY-associated TM helix domain-containing protein n=1 Tax=Colwellia sp. D2M02 TaxID=2841562 RepID=UPI001C0951FB|nr:PepSY-associated TM helix domain-containing protein [Colwellia sp. D2M02]